MSISYLFGVEGILLYDVVNEKERESCSEKVSISLSVGLSQHLRVLKSYFSILKMCDSDCDILPLLIRLASMNQ